MSGIDHQMLPFEGTKQAPEEKNEDTKTEKETIKYPFQYNFVDGTVGRFPTLKAMTDAIAEEQENMNKD